MLVVVDLVAEEDRLFVIAEDPGAVVRRLARAEVDHSERDVVEGHALAVADRRVREGPLGPPLVAEHRPQDLFLLVVVPDDRVDHALRRDDRHIVARDQLRQASVVVRMRVSQKHRAQRLPELF